MQKLRVDIQRGAAAAKAAGLAAFHSILRDYQLGPDDGFGSEPMAVMFTVALVLLDTVAFYKGVTRDELLREHNAIYVAMGRPAS